MRGGGIEVETVSEEDYDESTIDHDNLRIDEDEEKEKEDKEEERIMQSDTSVNIPMEDDDETKEKYPRKKPTNTNTVKDMLPNEIKALSGRKFTGDKLKTYGDEIKKKEEGMLRISGFNNNSINLDEIRATCQDSIDLQVDIQCFQEVCRDTRKSSILQRFLKDTKKSDPTSKSVWGSSTVNVGNDYKPGGTAIVAFGKTARRVIKQGIDDLGRWS